MLMSLEAYPPIKSAEDLKRAERWLYEDQVRLGYVWFSGRSDYKNQFYEVHSVLGAKTTDPSLNSHLQELSAQKQTRYFICMSVKAGSVLLVFEFENQSNYEQAVLMLKHKKMQDRNAEVASRTMKVQFPPSHVLRRRPFLPEMGFPSIQVGDNSQVQIGNSHSSQKVETKHSVWGVINRLWKLIFTRKK